MPLMPTTRRGRFLFYKARALKRLKKVNWRRHRDPADPAHSKCMTTRAIDTTGETKQMPRVYPQNFAEKAMDPAEWLLHGWTAPTFQKWGWLGDGSWTLPPIGGRRRPRRAIVGYHDRRVLSIPRLKKLPRKSYLLPQGLLVPRQVYPNAVYPSGRESYASIRGWV